MSNHETPPNHVTSPIPSFSPFDFANNANNNSTPHAQEMEDLFKDILGSNKLKEDQATATLHEDAALAVLIQHSLMQDQSVNQMESNPFSKFQYLNTASPYDTSQPSLLASIFSPVPLTLNTLPPSLSSVQADATMKQESKSTVPTTTATPIKINNNKTDKKSKIAGVEADKVDASRTWTTQVLNNGVATASILMKTRTDSYSHLVPEILYASLKYDIKVDISGEALSTEPFIMAVATLHSLENDEYIPVELENGEEILKELPQVALVKSNSTFSGKLKVQLNNHLSSHKTDKEYCLQINFYADNKLKHSLVTVISPMFKTFARRPNKKKNERKKRKTTLDAELSDTDNEEEMEESTTKPVTKKVKTETQPTATLEQFTTALLELVECKNHLSSADQSKADSLIAEKFGPNFQL